MKTKKLTINRETIRNLTNTELESVNGGGDRGGTVIIDITKKDPTFGTIACASVACPSVWCSVGCAPPPIIR